jgi:hypothetical protein
MFRPAIVTLAAAAMIAGPAGAADKEVRASPLLDALTKCRNEPDPAARVACYDGAVDAISSARAKKDIVILDKEDVRQTRRGLFGFSLPKLPFFGGKDDDPGNEVPDEVRSTVKSARSLGYGKWRIVIEDGAIWETTEARMGFDDPKPGAAVLIERGAITNYFIKIGNGRRVSAKRVG